MRRVVLAIVVALASLVVPITAASGTSVPVPTADPFYRVPSGIAGLANGTLLGSRSIVAYADGLVIDGVHAWQVRYKTLGSTGAATATLATILVPTARWTGPGRRPLVSYDLAEDGLGLRCTPSWAIRGDLSAGLTVSEAEVTYGIRQLLAHNWAVVLPDYEGPQSLFSSAPMAAHGILDGIRAARRFAPAGVGASPVALWGYSGGGFATSSAALAQRTYAPEIPLRAVAMGGVPGDMVSVFNAAAGSAAGGATLLILGGLSRANPSAHLMSYVDSVGQTAMAAESQDCLFDAILREPLFNLRDHMTPAGLQLLLAIGHRNSPLYLPGSIRVPVFDYHVITDELVPYATASALAQQLCHRGTRVDFAVDPLGEHATEEALGGLKAISYLADRFAGRPAPTTCG